MEISGLKLSHLAIAAPEIQRAVERLAVLGLKVEKTHSVPSEKVNAAMVPVGFSKAFRIEVLEPQAADSPLAGFLAKRPAGGLHHLCFEVERLEPWLPALEQAGIEVLSPGIRKSARGRALFLHPKSMCGILVELEEIA